MIEEAPVASERSVQSHRDLRVWQKGVDLAVLMYEVVKHFPSHERYGLSSQLTRAAASGPANIAEGNARSTTREYAHFISIARGSLMEVETFVTIALRIGYLSEQDAATLLRQIADLSKMLRSLRQRLIAKSD